MGGKGSGTHSNDAHGGGRPKKAAVAIVGTGVPVRPEGMSHRQSQLWDGLVELLAGVAFEQDSHAVWRIAVLMEREEELDELVTDAMSQRNLDECERWLRLSDMTERRLDTKCGKFGMTSRERQLLLIPKEEAVEKSRKEQWLDE